MEKLNGEAVDQEQTVKQIQSDIAHETPRQ